MTAVWHNSPCFSPCIKGELGMAYKCKIGMAPVVAWACFRNCSYCNSLNAYAFFLVFRIYQHISYFKKYLANLSYTPFYFKNYVNLLFDYKPSNYICSFESLVMFVCITSFLFSRSVCHLELFQIHCLTLLL